MFRIINFSRLIKSVVTLTVFFSVTVYALILHFSPTTSLFKLFSISSAVAALLIFLIGSNFTARWIWSVMRVFDGSLFPDINGAWEGEIMFEGGQLTARAIIRQTLSHTQIDLHTPTSKSITLESTPVSESGQPRLYYVHRVTPHNPHWHIYTGSTLFDVRHVRVNGKKVLELSGHYYTDRKTNGRIRLRQIGHDCSQDVSYY